jgi:glutamyl/glutaminyl-tRNA synthetase
MINKTKNYKGGKKIDLPNKPFTITNPLSSTQKIQENAENIQKLNMEYIRVSSDDVLLKNFREEMKNGGVNSSQYNANKEHKDRLDKTKGAIKQIVKALDKLEKKNEAQDKEISEIESGTPEDVKDINVESSNVELGNANIKEDIKQINDRLKNVEG